MGVFGFLDFVGVKKGLGLNLPRRGAGEMFYRFDVRKRAVRAGRTIVPLRELGMWEMHGWTDG